MTQRAHDKPCKCGLPPWGKREASGRFVHGSSWRDLRSDQGGSPQFYGINAVMVRLDGHRYFLVCRDCHSRGDDIDPDWNDSEENCAPLRPFEDVWFELYGEKILDFQDDHEEIFGPTEHRGWCCCFRALAERNKAKMREAIERINAEAVQFKLSAQRCDSGCCRLLYTKECSNGTVQYVWLCLWCGDMSNPISHEAAQTAIRLGHGLRNTAAGNQVSVFGESEKAVRRNRQQLISGVEPWRREEIARVQIECDSQWRALYAHYRASPEWRKVRRVVLTRDRDQCAQCGSRCRLHVHHMTYERIGAELPEDLVALCARCHEKAHSRR